MTTQLVNAFKSSSLDYHVSSLSAQPELNATLGPALLTPTHVYFQVLLA